MFPMWQSFTSFDFFDLAFEISERWQYHFYDAMIISAAIQSDCQKLYSEDLQDRQKIFSVTVINPFVESS
jgi:predicted nucleic acid-binding protein